MVLDNITGLVWEAKKARDGVTDYANPHDADNLYTWCDTNPDTNGGAEGACAVFNTKDLIASLNSGSGFGGYKDWRLPTIVELAALANRTVFNPAIDTTYFPLTVLSGYWTSTTYAGNESYAWFTHFDYGYSDSFNKTDSYYVRAVRGETMQPADRFVDNMDGTVSDTLNCLQWQQPAADTTGDGFPDTMNWQAAIDYANSLSLAGHDDWRLPNIYELLSILDYSQYRPAMDEAVFPQTEPYYFWSSTVYPDSTNKSWTVYFSNGYDSGRLQNYPSYVRAVRGQRCGTASSALYTSIIPLYLLLNGK